MSGKGQAGKTNHSRRTSVHNTFTNTRLNTQRSHSSRPYPPHLHSGRISHSNANNNPSNKSRMSHTHWGGHCTPESFTTPAQPTMPSLDAPANPPNTNKPKPIPTQSMPNTTVIANNTSKKRTRDSSKNDSNDSTDTQSVNDSDGIAVEPPKKKRKSDKNESDTNQSIDPNFCKVAQEAGMMTFMNDMFQKFMAQKFAEEKERYKQMETVCREMEQKCERLKAEKHKIETEISNKYKSEISEIQKKFDGEKERFKTEKEGFKAEKEGLSAEKQKLQTENESLNKAYEQMKETCTKDNKNFTLTINALQRGNETLKKDLSLSKGENTELRKVYDGLKQQMNEKWTKDIDAAKRENATLKRDYNGMRERNDGLKQEISTLRQENDGLKRQNSEMGGNAKELNAMREQYNKLKNDSAAYEAMKTILANSAFESMTDDPALAAFEESHKIFTANQSGMAMDESSVSEEGKQSEMNCKSESQNTEMTEVDLQSEAMDSQNMQEIQDVFDGYQDTNANNKKKIKRLNKRKKELKEQNAALEREKKDLHSAHILKECELIQLSRKLEPRQLSRFVKVTSKEASVYSIELKESEVNGKFLSKEIKKGWEKKVKKERKRGSNGNNGEGSDDSEDSSSDNSDGSESDSEDNEAKKRSIHTD